MADLVQTPADVIQYTGVNPNVIPGVSGEAINAGMPCYQTNATNQRWFQANSSNALLSGAITGIRISLASAPGAGQPLSLIGAGRINLGATLVAGETYVVSLNSGKIKPFSDLLNNEYTTILGFATNNAALTLAIAASNVARTTNAG